MLKRPDIGVQQSILKQRRVIPIEVLFESFYFNPLFWGPINDFKNVFPAI